MPRSTASGRRQKGQDFQKERAAQICRILDISPTDLRSTPSSLQGCDLWLSDVAAAKFPFGVEMKRTESLHIFQDMKQAEINAAKIGKFPLLVFKRNHSKVYACMEFETLLRYISAYNQLANLVK